MENKHIKYFSEIILKEGGKLLNGDSNLQDIEPYLTSERKVNGVKTGISKLVLLPKTTQQVSQILKYCNKNNISIFTQGGNTGLVGGSIADESGKGIVISTKYMNEILSDISSESISVKLQAGVVIDALNEKISPHNLFCSIKHGGTGSCNIGGSLATNAGGSNALKYGVVKDQILGFTVVLPNGEILKFNSNLKDTTGINIKDIFIGSEGSLGVITEAEIKLHPIPKSTETILLGLNSFEEIDVLYSSLRKEFGPYSLEAFEYMNKQSYNLSFEFTEGSKSIPLSLECNHYVLAEISSYDKNNEDLQSKLLNFFDNNQKIINIDEVMLSMSKTERNLMWLIREHCSSASKNFSGGNGIWFDDCVPFEKVESSIQRTQEYLHKNYTEFFENEVIKLLAFGHRADGNIHIHIVQNQNETNFKIQDHLDELEEHRLKLISELGGNPFAEHGVGIKTKRMKYIQPEQIELMKKIKSLIDPNYIMNPGRVLPL